MTFEIDEWDDLTVAPFDHALFEGSAYLCVGSFTFAIVSNSTLTM